MMIFKKAIPRRKFLRGMGAALALPLLDGMVPAFAGPADANAKPVRRLAFVFLPNGRIMENWTPATDGAAFEFTPILEPLAPFRDSLVVVSGLSHGIPSAGNHSGPCCRYLTGVYPSKGGVHVGTSVDQIAAREFGKHTQLASLEISLDSGEFVGACEGTMPCSYTNTICWRTATTPLPMENNPRVIFERLFSDGASTDPADRVARIQGRRSILDFVTADANRLMTRVRPSDSRRIKEYLEAVRDIERRIELAEQQSSRELPHFDRPAGVPATFEEHAKLMFDLQLLAYQTDLTRVNTFMMGCEISGRTYPELGIPDPHHPLTHHNGDTEKIAKVTKINTHQSKMLAYYLDRMRSTPDGAGSLFDHTTILCGASLSDANTHAYNNLPILLFPGNESGIQAGRHVRFAKDKDIPLASLHLTLLDKLGIPVEDFGEGAGKLQPLSI